MYAIVETGGKQYRVEPGQVLEVERLDGDVGSTITLEKVLFVAGEGETKIGNPTVANAKVTGEVVGQGRSRKIIVFKKKRRKAYRRTNGHRQSFTALKITGILEG
jgi:large subunit ribosomal protein L21